MREAFPLHFIRRIQSGNYETALAREKRKIGTLEDGTSQVLETRWSEYACFFLRFRARFWLYIYWKSTIDTASCRRGSKRLLEMLAELSWYYAYAGVQR